MATPTPAAKPDTGAAIQSLLAQLQQGGAGAGTADFLGLPSNTADPSGAIAADQAAQQQWAQGRRAPAYANGSQYLPVYQSWTPQDIAAVQTRLVNAGLLANTDFRAGVWDSESQKAFGEVLGVANNMGAPWQDALTQYESGTPMVWDPKSGTYVKGTAGTARTKAPVATRFTNPDDIATTAQEIATAKLGRTFNPEELQRFVAAYHGMESGESAGQAAAGSGGGFTAAPSIQTAADTFAQQADPTAYTGEKFLAMAQHLNDVIKGPQLATTKPMSA